MKAELLNKYNKLKEYIKEKEAVAVAFSGGVDSTFLLYAALETLGEKALAITAVIHSVPESELKESQEFCEQLGIRQICLRHNELEIPGFAENPVNRCYICKKALFSQIIKTANENGITAILEGSNLDDNGDYRPGLMAISELKVLSPLREVGFTKKEIRELSGYFNLSTWNKPSAACLSSRIPYGDVITEEKLKRIEKSEQYLHELGFIGCRVRLHSDVARIELPPAMMEKMFDSDIRNLVYEKLVDYGFKYVALDLKGYRTGSLNETITNL